MKEKSIFDFEYHPAEGSIIKSEYTQLAQLIGLTSHRRRYDCQPIQFYCQPIDQLSTNSQPQFDVACLNYIRRRVFGVDLTWPRRWLTSRRYYNWVIPYEIYIFGITPPRIGSQQSTIILSNIYRRILSLNVIFLMVFQLS